MNLEEPMSDEQHRARVRNLRKVWQATRAREGEARANLDRAVMEARLAGVDTDALT